MEWADSIARQWREDRQRAPIANWEPHVLIVDDEQHVRDVFQIVLRDFGVVVEIASSGHETLEKLEAKLCTRCPPWDLVFLDLLMPGLSGVEVLAELKKRCPRIPVVIVTGYPDSDMLHHASELGYIGLILKPFSRDQLREILEAHRLVLANKTAPKP